MAIRLLGPVRLTTADGAEVGLRGHRARLLAWLALRPGRPWAADDLVDRLWPAGPPPTARTALQGHVAKLRGALGDRSGTGLVAIETVGSAYVLRAEAGAVDAGRFDALADEARAASGRRDPAAAVRALTDALALWSGPALADVRDDALLGVEAAALDARRADAEDDLARALLAAGEAGAAVDLLERLVAAEPLRERRWGQLMVALHRDGRQADALRAYQRAVRVLAEEAGLAPGRELRRIERAVLVHDPVLEGARSWAAGRLPAPLTAVVGRDAERAEVRERLRSSRLVTLVGPGGVGKTTMALDVAAGVAPALADGAVVVDLAGAGPDDVDQAVAAAFGTEAGGDPLQPVAAALAGADVLVVLDNCEHVLAEAARVAVALLRAGPGVRILATSQEPLQVAGEAVVALEPLAVPPEGAGPDEVERSGAGRLLAERLRASGRPPAGEADWRRVAAVARAAGGLPLAIEVAAAWGRTEGLDVVAERLGGDDVLRAEPPVGAGRRRLGAALDAAVARLYDPARRAYAAAGLFPAWFGVDALGAAAGLPAGAAGPAGAALVDVSLALADPADPARLRLLPPVRRHAAGRLGTGAEADAAAQRLLSWCLATAAELDAAAHGHGLPAAVDRLMADLPTMRAVLHRALDGGHAAEAARLFAGLGFCWAGSPAAPELARWGAEVLRHAKAVPAGERVRVEVLALQAADTFEAVAAHVDRAEELVARADAAGDDHAAASARMVLAMGLGWRGERLADAGALVAEARAAMQVAGDGFWAAEALTCQGLLALRRLDLAGGTALLEESLAEHQAVGTPVGVARALFFVGVARRIAGDLGGARRAFVEVRRLLAGGRVTTWLRATTALGHAVLAEGDLDAAVAAFQEAHARATEVGDQRIAVQAMAGVAAAVRRRDGDRHAVPLVLAAAEQALEAGEPFDAALAATALAEVLAAGDRPDHAAVLLGAAGAVPPPGGVRLDLAASVDADVVAGALSDRLGRDTYARLEADGRLLGLPAALAQARSALDGAGLVGIPGDAAAPKDAGVPGVLGGVPYAGGEVGPAAPDDVEDRGLEPGLDQLVVDPPAG